MMPYVVMFCLFLTFFTFSLDKRTKIHLLIPVLSVLIILFVGIRYDSIDYFSYRKIYDYVDNFSELQFPNYIPSSGEKPIEFLYSFIILIVKFFGGSFYIFIFIVALISIYIKLLAFKKMSNSFYMSTLLYLAVYLANDMGQIRNGFSSGLVLLSVYYLYRRDTLYFFVLVLSASLIHLVSALALALYFVRYFSKNYFLYLSLLTSFTTAVAGGAGIFFAELVATAFGFGEEFRLVSYMTSRHAESYSVFGGTLIIYSLTALISIMFRRKLVSVNEYNFYFIPIYVYGVCLMLLFSDYGILLARVKDLFCVPSSMILLPSYIYIFKPAGRLVVAFALVIYAVFMFVLFMPSASYKSVLFN